MRIIEAITHHGKRELFTVSRFILVGIFAAFIHIGLVWTLITQIGVLTLLANLVAFLTAFIVSFTGHYMWTFRARRHWKSALIRFLLISLCGFAANNIVLITLLDLGVMSDSLAAILSACVIPVITFIAGRFWAFR